ncbi:LCP family protein [Candidatus Beckwithbacteria bacterium]|nr:LCP family protein [Candidatus Beckwithbacteria bacterium]
MNPTDYSNTLFWQRIKRWLLRHIWFTRVVIILSFLAVLTVLISLFSKPVSSLLQKILYGPKVVTTFFTDPLYTLPSYQNHTNILILGKGNASHEAADLTDTIIFLSLDLVNNEVLMLSIPRDIWITSLAAKINTAYYYGEQKEKGGGFPLVEDAVYEIVGQPIHYVAMVDFDGFVKLIDLLGGVDVTVDQSFTDEFYPIPGKEDDECNGDPEFRCRYEVLHFEKGLQHMDGQTALKFSRSRHAEGDEGTDFARSARQQKVLKAIKEKLSSSQVYLNPSKLLELKKLASQYITFNKDISEKIYAGLAGFGYNFWRSGKEITTITLDTGDDDNPGFLVNPPVEKYDQWVLEPSAGTWDEFQAYLRQKMK